MLNISCFFSKEIFLHFIIHHEKYLYLVLKKRTILIHLVLFFPLTMTSPMKFIPNYFCGTLPHFSANLLNRNALEHPYLYSYQSIFFIISIQLTDSHFPIGFLLFN